MGRGRIFKVTKDRVTKVEAAVFRILLESNRLEVSQWGIAMVYGVSQWGISIAKAGQVLVEGRLNLKGFFVGVGAR